MLALPVLLFVPVAPYGACWQVGSQKDLYRVTEIDRLAAGTLQLIVATTLIVPPTWEELCGFWTFKVHVMTVFGTTALVDVLPD